MLYLTLRAAERLGFRLDWFRGLSYDEQLELLSFDHLRRLEESEAMERATSDD